ncbi:FHA domain-containing protein [Mycetocola sp. 2940]|uniref:FHA domain-containing protein n=1 Tax=Mycetocola sp. 2940 TaxID=3156452 RepID=UPI003396D813
MSTTGGNEWNGFEIPPRPPLPASDPAAPVRKIGMPPGMEPSLDTVPSSDHGIPVPVARPEFGAAPTPNPAGVPVAPVTAPVTAPAPVVTSLPNPRLELPDGRVLPLENGLIVGRDPQPQEGYGVTERARLHDVERSVSKTHAILGISDGTIWVLDLNSTNGTVLLADDGTETLCTPEVATPIPADTDVRFGEYRVHVAVG